MPSPGVSNVILTATNQFRLSSHKPDFYGSYGRLNLNTIAAGLTHAGFNRVAFTTPEGIGHPPDLERHSGAILDCFARLGAGEDGAIIGISTTTEEFYKYRALTRMLKGSFPGSQIVAGGSHFVRERFDGYENYRDPVEDALMAGNTDAVVVGHAQPFVDFVVKHDGRKEEVETPGFYQLDPLSGKIVGHGRSGYPAVGELPYNFREGTNSMDVLLSNVCRNGCDYCAGMKTSARPVFSVDMVVEGMKRAIKETGVDLVKFYDPNMFDPASIGYYEDIFVRLDEGRPIRKHTYLDPAVLLSEEHKERVSRMLTKSMILYLFAGRDQVTEKGAALLGRRYHGRLKDQAMLDGERDALKDLVGRAQEAHRWDSNAPERLLTLSYIVTHMETMETALAAYEDMMTFLAMDRPGIQVHIEISPLMPYPGTRVRKRHSDAIDLADFEFFRNAGDRLTPWKKDAGPGVELMRRAAFLHRANGAKKTVEEFREAIDQSF